MFEADAHARVHAQIELRSENSSNPCSGSTRRPTTMASSGGARAVAVAALLVVAAGEPLTPVVSVMNDVHRTQNTQSALEGVCEGENCGDDDGASQTLRCFFPRRRPSRSMSHLHVLAIVRNSRACNSCLTHEHTLDNRALPCLFSSRGSLWYSLFIGVASHTLFLVLHHHLSSHWPVGHGVVGVVMLDLLSFEFDEATDASSSSSLSDSGYIGQWEGEVKSGHGMETTEVRVTHDAPSLSHHLVFLFTPVIALFLCVSHSRTSFHSNAATHEQYSML